MGKRMLLEGRGVRYARIRCRIYIFCFLPRDITPPPTLLVSLFPRFRDGLDELQEDELRNQKDAMARRWKRQQHNAARQRGGAAAPEWDVDQEVRGAFPMRNSIQAQAQ